MTGSVLVAIIDDDESVRESLPELIGEFGYAVSVFASAEEFISSGCIEHARCLILDVAMPGMSGPELQRELVRCGYHTPIIFITAHSDVTELLEQGAAACLFKPFSDTELLGALNAALGVD